MTMKNIGMIGIPMMNVDGMKEAPVLSKGASNYVTTIPNTSKEEYLTYLSQLEDSGFEKYAENTEGIGGTVFSATFKKDSLVLTVAYYSLEKNTSISFYTGPVSKHLVYDDTYLNGNEKDSKTKLHMVELWRFGNSFIFQLKNGHFVISDGGTYVDLPYLLDYLEELTPEGEKPHIEAWIISHSHGDHCGALIALSEHSDWIQRIYVDGVYFSEPSEEVADACGGDMENAQIKWVTRMLQASDGGRTKFYRPQTGQRYYFNDISMDILICQEQVPLEDYHDDLNTSSTVCVFNIEGQKVCLSGDIHQEGMQFIVNNYTEEYLNLEFFSLNHHGFNTSSLFTEKSHIQTVFVTTRDVLPINALRETKALLNKATESIKWGDGTTIYTFPYTVGSYEQLPKREWIYNEGEFRGPQPSLYVFCNVNFKVFVFDADSILFDGERLKADIKECLAYLHDKTIRISVYSATKDTDSLLKQLKDYEIDNYFELVLGAEQLGGDKPCVDALHKTEETFQVDQIHKYVFVSNQVEVVREIVLEGARTLVITEGQEVCEEVEYKAWKKFKTFHELYDYFESRNVIFE